MELPLITILTLVYNTGQYVIEALESVRLQNYPNIQHIVIDDCSTDCSVKTVSKWIVENNYDCQLIVHPKNLGITKSLNEGLRLAKGKYIAIVCDDLFLPGKLIRQVKIMENLPEDYCMVYSDIYLQNNKGDDLGTLLEKTKNLKKGPEGDIFEELYLGNFIQGTAALTKMVCYKDVGYYNENLIVEDIDLLLKMAQKYKFKFDDEISAIYRIHDKSLLHTIGLKGLEENLKSLQTFARYNQNTLDHFISYIDVCLPKFHRQAYAGWENWYKKRWEYRKDLKSIAFYLIALFNLDKKSVKRLKMLRKPSVFFKRIVKKVFKND